MDELMPIGDFSARSGLSPKQLRSYAASGLLTPAAVDPYTAYRYYSPAQLGDARLIDALRDAGIPLAEISLLLRDRDPGRLRAWAARVRDDAERRHEALDQALALLGCAADRPTGRNTMAYLDCAGRTDIGLVRENNEDAIVTGSRFVAVADGLGGHAGGEVASRLATELVAASFTGGSLDELATAVRAANFAVWERGSSTAGSEGMGTTLVAAGLVGDGVLGVVHVGDSRAYLVRDGGLQRLTEDHTVAAQMVRDGELTEADAVGHPHRSVLTRALGVGPDVPLDAVERAVVPGDRLVLCSDGLFNHVPDDELAALALSGASPQAAVDTLLELGLARGGEDNLSVVVADVRA
ncbi:protein phosphatase 2C domain-containing protein [Petropleomorpha daqingensis]|uniref:Protein phosphatase n=1 Tax=Petropleomorpha daqingensis TaxID=2026353 RepID=A0A853CF85_9ACTN|nr:protein phosphatase [Petropleomorpha daqingensis]